MVILYMLGLEKMELSRVMAFLRTVRLKSLIKESFNILLNSHLIKVQHLYRQDHHEELEPYLE